MRTGLVDTWNGPLLYDSSYLYIAPRIESALQTAGCIEEFIGTYLAREYKYAC
jgi:hypothetical protein